MSDLPDNPLEAASDAGAELVSGPDVSRLGSLARRGAAWTLGLIISRQVIGLGATAVLARLLYPSDYGIIGMVATLTAFVRVFADMGLSMATVQRKDLSAGQVANLFWINAGLGTLLWAACAASGPVLAWFYGQEELALVAAALGASFALGGVAVQPMALLKRQMLFGRLSVAEFASFVVGAGTGLSLAFAGWGYWALVGQSLAAQAGRAVFLLAASGYRPALPKLGRGTLSLLKFGGSLACYGIVVCLTHNLDRVLIGKVWGPGALGYYGRAYFLMNLPTMVTTGALAQVMLPALSALQNDSERYRRVYLRTMRLVAFVSLPMAFGMLATARETVLVIYGARWTEVVPIFRLLCVVAIVSPFAMSMGWLYVSLGRTNRLWRWTLFRAPVTCAALMIGLPYGQRGVAAAYAAAVAVLVVPSLWYGAGTAGIRLRQVLAAIWAPSASAGLMGAAVWALGRVSQVQVMPALGALALKVGAGATVYLLCSLLLSRRHLEELRQHLPAPLNRLTAAALLPLRLLQEILQASVTRVNPSPILILGNQKSGTTAVAALLAEATGCSVTLDIVEEMRRPILPLVRRGELAFADFVEKNKLAFSRAIVKEPNLTPFREELAARFPDAKFVLVVRDPRDNVRSILDRLGVPGDLEGVKPEELDAPSPSWRHVIDGRWLGLSGDDYIEMLAARWNLAADSALHSKGDLILLRYEDFVKDKVGEIARLAGKLGLQAVNDISSMVDTPFQPRGRNRGIDWLAFFGAENLGKIELICRERMVLLGYAVEAEH